MGGQRVWTHISMVSPVYRMLVGSARFRPARQKFTLRKLTVSKEGRIVEIRVGYVRYSYSISVHMYISILYNRIVNELFAPMGIGRWCGAADGSVQECGCAWFWLCKCRFVFHMPWPQMAGVAINASLFQPRSRLSGSPLACMCICICGWRVRRCEWGESRGLVGRWQVGWAVFNWIFQWKGWQAAASCSPIQNIGSVQFGPTGPSYAAMDRKQNC